MKVQARCEAHPIPATVLGDYSPREVDELIMSMNRHGIMGNCHPFHRPVELKFVVVQGEEGDEIVAEIAIREAQPGEERGGRGIDRRPR